MSRANSVTSSGLALCLFQAAVVFVFYLFYPRGAVCQEFESSSLYCMLLLTVIHNYLLTNSRQTTASWNGIFPKSFHAGQCSVESVKQAVVMTDKRSIMRWLVKARVILEFVDTDRMRSWSDPRSNPIYFEKHIAKNSMHRCARTELCEKSQSQCVRPVQDRCVGEIM
jgi:hypothetical protein